MSSRIEYQWRDEGSGAGHMQRVRIYSPNPLQVAWSAYITHAAGCADCGDERCPVAEPLWLAYWRERRTAAYRAKTVRSRS